MKLHLVNVSRFLIGYFFPGAVEDFKSLKKQNPELIDTLHQKMLLLPGLFRQMLAWELSVVICMYPTSWFIDGLRTLPTSQLVAIATVVFLISYLATKYLHQPYDNKRNSFFYQIWATLWVGAHYKELRLSTDWHVKHGTGQKEEFIGKNVIKVENLFDTVLFQGFPMLVRIICTTLIIGFLAWPFAVLAVVSIIGYVYVCRSNEPTWAPLRKVYHKGMHDIGREGTEQTIMWRVIRGLGVENEFVKKHEESLKKFCTTEDYGHAVVRALFSRCEYLVQFFQFLLYVLAAVIINEPRFGLTVGSVVIAFMWMQRMFGHMYQLIDVQRSLGQGVPALKELLGILNTQPSIQNHSNPIIPKNIQGELEFKNVSFKYEGANKPALNNISFKVPSGKSLAIVGYTGSGKSTAASLIGREYDVDSGNITVDGCDIRKYDFFFLRRCLVTVVLQQTQLFEGTIADNVRIGKPGATDEEVMQALKKAHCLEFVLELSKGMHTDIGENGIQLSGGQRQRVALARAFVRDSKILVLDEATSALDGKSQSEVTKAINELMESGNCTCVIIAHRFSTIQKADLIAVIDKGGLVGFGTHDDLAQNNYYYQELLKHEYGKTFEPVKQKAVCGV
jgi:ATP-binding cassette subfamily B protein